MEKQDSESKLADADHSNDLQMLLDEFMKDYDTSNENSCFSCMCCPTPLLRCSGCQLVTYCDRECQREDWKYHKYLCREFPVVNGSNTLYTKVSWGKHLAKLRERAARLVETKVIDDEFQIDMIDRIFQNPRVCHNCWDTKSENITLCKCTCVSYCSDKCADTDFLHEEKCEHFRQVLLLSYTTSIFNALHEVSSRLHQGGDSECSFYDMVNLTIHVVDNTPIFNSTSWEGFMRKFPKLEKLTVVFVIQCKGFIPYLILNYPLSVVNTASIKYSIQQMNYHMFFSSIEYTEPDVVVVFGNTTEMELDDEYVDSFQSEMSYRNMVYNSRTILVLMDRTEELVSIGTKTVNAVQSVTQLVLPQVNPIIGVISNEEPDIDFGSDFLNFMKYFTCLRRE